MDEKNDGAKDVEGVAYEFSADSRSCSTCRWKSMLLISSVGFLVGEVVLGSISLKACFGGDCDVDVDDIIVQLLGWLSLIVCFDMRVLRMAKSKVCFDMVVVVLGAAWNGGSGWCLLGLGWGGNG